MVLWTFLCQSCGFVCRRRVLKTFPGPGHLRLHNGVVWQWHWLVNLYIWLTNLSGYGSTPFTLGLIKRDGGLSTLFSKLQVCLSAKGAKNIFCPCLSPLRRSGSLTTALTGKFVSMDYHFILLRLNPFDLGVDREGWWFEHSHLIVVCLLASKGF